MSDLRAVIRFWMRKVRGLRIKLALVNSDYADLLADFHELIDRYVQALIDLRRARDVRDEIAERNSLLYREISDAEQRISELEAIAGRVEDRRYLA